MTSRRYAHRSVSAGHTQRPFTSGGPERIGPLSLIVWPNHRWMLNYCKRILLSVSIGEMMTTWACDYGLTRDARGLTNLKSSRCQFDATSKFPSSEHQRRPLFNMLIAHRGCLTGSRSALVQPNRASKNKDSSTFVLSDSTRCNCCLMLYSSKEALDFHLTCSSLLLVYGCLLCGCYNQFECQET